MSRRKRRRRGHFGSSGPAHQGHGRDTSSSKASVSTNSKSTGTKH